jgi:hypothetical protein
VTWTEFHTESERLASSGEAAFRLGDLQRALELYRRAAEAESKALEVLPAIKLRTIGITAVSAVALWYKAREYSKAAKLAHKWLGGDGLPAFAVDQLNHLLQLVWTSGAADRAGVRFVPGDVVVAVKGGTVVHGGAPLDLIVHKIDEIQAVYYRTIEMLLNRPLRRRGAPLPDVQELFRPWLFQAPAGSYQFAVRIQEPPQRELFPGAQPSVDKVTSTFLAIIMATATDPLRGLAEVVPDPEYRTTFLKLARNLAPTGKRFTEVEIRDASIPAASAISFNPASREAINAVLREQRSSVIEEESIQVERLSGVLRAVHLDEDWLELATDNPVRPHVRIDDAGDALDDVVGPMVNRRVFVTVAQGSRNRLLFKDIEVEE